MTRHPASVLFVTLDSCRYDTFVTANAPCLKSVGRLYKAMAPGNFTYSSHAAMFMGFTPGLAGVRESFINPKFGKIFKMADGGFGGVGEHFMTLEGANLVDSLKRKGYFTAGSGAVQWFNPKRETGQNLTRDFHQFYYPGTTFSLQKQLAWFKSLPRDAARPDFLFLNVGETHAPYYYEEAVWDRKINPCVPFSPNNDAVECARRQKACLEYVDRELGSLLEEFRESTTIVCADHGDCWGEDGLWQHSIHHQKVLEVPLLFRLGQPL